MAKKTVHTAPLGNKWEVKLSKTSQPVSLHRTQAAAIEQGKRLAQQKETEHFIHNRHGEIRERNSYGNDPKESKG